MVKIITDPKYTSKTQKTMNLADSLKRYKRQMKYAPIFVRNSADKISHFTMQTLTYH